MPTKVFFVFQVGPIVILVLFITVYGFARPYKERLANILELIVQSCFLFLLLLLSVASTHNTLLTFSGDGTTNKQCNNQPNNVAGIAWLLFPVLYFPHVLFLIVSGVILSHLAWWVSTLKYGKLKISNLTHYLCPILSLTHNSWKLCSFEYKNILRFKNSVSSSRSFSYF